MFIIYVHKNFDIVVANDTNDGAQEVGPETSGLVLYHGNIVILIWKYLNWIIMEP